MDSMEIQATDDAGGTIETGGTIEAIEAIERMADRWTVELDQVAALVAQTRREHTALVAQVAQVRADLNHVQHRLRLRAIRRRPPRKRAERSA